MMDIVYLFDLESDKFRFLAVPAWKASDDGMMDCKEGEGFPGFGKG